MELRSDKEPAVNGFPAVSQTQSVLFTQTVDSAVTIGMVTHAEPSSLTLLAAGVAGMAARRARRERSK